MSVFVVLVVGGTVAASPGGVVSLTTSGALTTCYEDTLCQPDPDGCYSEQCHLGGPRDCIAFTPRPNVACYDCGPKGEDPGEECEDQPGFSPPICGDVWVGDEIMGQCICWEELWSYLCSFTCWYDCQDS